MTKLCDRRCGCSIHLACIGNFEEPCIDCAAKLRARLIEGSRIAIPQDDTATAGDQTLRDGKPDTHRSASDDGCASVEIDLIHGPQLDAQAMLSRAALATARDPELSGGF